MPTKTGWRDASLTLWDFSRSNKHCIHLSITKTISFASFLQCPHFRSSRPELFCKKGVLKNSAKFTGVSSGTGVSCEFFEKEKKKIFFNYFISEIPNFSYMSFFRKCSVFRWSIHLIHFCY